MDLDSSIERCKLTAGEKAQILRAGEVHVRSCADPKKEGIDQAKFVPINELASKFDEKLLATSPGDTLWNAGYTLKDDEETYTHSNWNGFMKSFYPHDTKSKDYIVYEPVIDATPEDHGTIYTVFSVSEEN